MNADTILSYSSAALSAMLAAGAAVRARRIPSRWAFVAGMMIVTMDGVLAGLQSRAIDPVELRNWQIWQLSAAALLPGIWLYFSLTYARGNAGFFLSRWRWLLGGFFLVPLLLVTLFRDGLIVSVSRVERDSAIIYNLGLPGIGLHLMLLIAALLILMNLERTYRASVGTVRWRIKFMLMGVGLLFIVRLFTVSQSLLFRGIIGSLDEMQSGAVVLAGLLMLRSLSRAGHFELDVYPSHAVLRNSVTILLAGIYLVFVGIFAKVAAYFGGDSSFSLKALMVLVALVGLAVVLQSDRVQMHLQHFVSRHFQRPLYDYRAIWHQFTVGTASQVGQTEYCRAVVKLLAEIFQALSVTLWVVDERHEEFILAASTSVSGRRTGSSVPTADEASTLIRELRAHPDPLEIEDLPDDWAVALRRCHPDEFHKGSRRTCLPIVAGSELLAVAILGDRVNGANFTPQDLDLLKSIGGHIASGLTNARLSQQLLQAREHEAFQTMATFFVHDLKNAATTLNLMLNNLPDHYDDPEFREDALRGVAKSVTHINHLISRLSQLRQEMKIQPVPSDLNQIVTGVLAGVEVTDGIRIERQLATLPPVSLDQAQISKVITNLVLNAREAIGAQGTLCLATGQSNAWAVLSVSDTGCGMSPDFIARSLFRPFQTTKKNGLGIGMFQSKMIVEAHRGRFSVESVPGKGTTFRVFLPFRQPTP